MKGCFERAGLSVALAIALSSPIAIRAELAVELGTAPSHSPVLLSIRLLPEEVTLWGRDASQRLLVLGKYSSRLEQDVTSMVRFSVSDPEVARVDESGKLLALADGETLLQADLEHHTVEVRVHATATGKDRPFSFQRDIGSIFAKRGCNGSSCHGGVKGRGGFKLSLDTTVPREDYGRIVEGGTFRVLTPDSDPKTPRINLAEPEKSLLLLKPTMRVVHEGGRRFGRGSSDYQTILNWIQKGAPYGEPDGQEEIRIERVEVLPREVVLEEMGEQQFLVTAYLSDGRREDITEEVRYESNNPEVVTVNDHGLATARGSGETALLMRAAGHVISARVGVIKDPIPNYPGFPRRNFIDDFVFSKLERFHILPSDLAGDGEFLRRVCLDVVGTLPPPARVREFLASKDLQKRDRLIEILLNSPEYVDYWTFRFSDLFRVANYVTGGSPKDSQSYWEWIRSTVAENRPYDQIARERLAAQGARGAARHYLPFGSVTLVQAAVAEEVKVFMGRRMDCAQCHNHPFENWSQEQFWGLAAFFGRMTSFGGLIVDEPVSRSRQGNVAIGAGKVIHPRTKEEVQPTFLNGESLGQDTKTDPRAELATWMTSHPYFAEAAVNRMWSHFFGRGLVQPVDDFRSSNPPTHPKLLEALARDFREQGHDLKRLIRLIVQSRTYQLSSRPNETNADDTINYSRARYRPLDAEVLLDAISQVTGVPEVYYNETPGGTRGEEEPGTRAINLMEADLYPNRFLEVHGRPLRFSLPERNVEPNLLQALHMLAGGTFTSKLSGEEGRLGRLLQSGASNREVIEELSLAALSRFPTGRERTELEEMLRHSESRTQAMEDLLWGLMTSREFAENH